MQTRCCYSQQAKLVKTHSVRPAYLMKVSTMWRLNSLTTIGGRLGLHTHLLRLTGKAGQALCTVTKVASKQPRRECQWAESEDSLHAHG